MFGVLGDVWLVMNCWEDAVIVQNSIYVLGKAHMSSTPSLRSFPSVSKFVWLTLYSVLELFDFHCRSVPCIQFWNCLVFTAGA